MNRDCALKLVRLPLTVVEVAIPKIDLGAADVVWKVAGGTGQARRAAHLNRLITRAHFEQKTTTVGLSRCIGPVCVPNRRMLPACGCGAQPMATSLFPDACSSCACRRGFDGPGQNYRPGILTLVAARDAAFDAALLAARDAAFEAAPDAARLAAVDAAFEAACEAVVAATRLAALDAAVPAALLAAFDAALEDARFAAFAAALEAAWLAAPDAAPDADLAAVLEAAVDADFEAAALTFDAAEEAALLTEFAVVLAVALEIATPGDRAPVLAAATGGAAAFGKLALGKELAAVLLARAGALVERLPGIVITTLFGCTLDDRLTLSTRVPLLLAPVEDDRDDPPGNPEMSELRLRGAE